VRKLRHPAIWLCCAILLCGFVATHEPHVPSTGNGGLGATLFRVQPEPAVMTARERALAGLVSVSAQLDVKSGGEHSLRQSPSTISVLQRLQYLFSAAASHVQPLLNGASETTATDVVDDGEAEDLCLYRVCRVTAYCDHGTTASGVESGVGQCAAPQDIPFGSLVYIPELRRTFVVTDRTHRRFRLNTVDIFIASEDECLEFGLNYMDCEFMLPPDAPPIANLTSNAR
jgi:3D (Asp-Asp-Asp) domain-containing protein